MNIMAHTPDALRTRILGLAKAVRQQDGGTLDRAGDKDQVKLRDADIHVGIDRLYSANASFDERGLKKLTLATSHQDGLTGLLDAKVTRSGDREDYSLSQDAQHGVGTFRARFSYDTTHGTFSNVKIKDGPLDGWTKALEAATSPVPYLVVAGGLITGMVSAALVGAGPAATAWFCGAGVTMTSALAFVGAVGEGYLLDDYK